MTAWSLQVSKGQYQVPKGIRNDVARTRVAEGDTTVGSGRTITSNIVAVAADTTKERAASIKQRANNAADIGSMWCEHAAEGVL